MIPVHELDEKQEEQPMEDVQSERAEKAEAATVNGKAKTLAHNAYRGRKE